MTSQTFYIASSSFEHFLNSSIDSSSWDIRFIRQELRQIYYNVDVCSSVVKFHSTFDLGRIDRTLRITGHEVVLVIFFKYTELAPNSAIIYFH